MLLTVYLLIRYVVQTLTVLRVVVLGDTSGVDVGLGTVRRGLKPANTALSLPDKGT